MELRSDPVKSTICDTSIAFGRLYMKTDGNRLASRLLIEYYMQLSIMLIASVL